MCRASLSLCVVCINNLFLASAFNGYAEVARNLTIRRLEVAFGILVSLSLLMAQAGNNFCSLVMV